MVSTRASSLRERMEKDKGVKSEILQVENHVNALPKVLSGATPPRTPRPMASDPTQLSNRLSGAFLFPPAIEHADVKKEDVDTGLEHVTTPIADDDASDITVVVLHHRHRFRFLSSKSVLSLSSPIIQRTIQTCMNFESPTGGWDDRDIPENPEWTIYLDGDPQAMQAVLLLLHLKGSDKFFNISFELFTEISVLCDRYAWQDALRPWVRAWLERFARNALKPGYENWLYIATVYNYDKKIKELVAALATEVSLPSGCGNFILRGERNISKTLWPAKYTDQILLLRGIEVARLTYALKKLVSTFKSGSVEFRKYCSSQVCADHVLGSLLRSIVQGGLSTLLEDGGEWRGSAINLKERMGAIQFDTLQKVMPNHTCALHAVRERFLAGFKGATRTRDAPQSLFELSAFSNS
ncbi:hypothetical protein TWF281_003088 [Arthrobotrys megalospora]